MWSVQLIVIVGMLQIGQEKMNEVRPFIRPCLRKAFFGHRAGWEFAVGGFKVVECQAELLEIVSAVGTSGRFAGGLYSR